MTPEQLDTIEARKAAVGDEWHVGTPTKRHDTWPEVEVYQRIEPDPWLIDEDTEAGWCDECRAGFSIDQDTVTLHLRLDVPRLWPNPGADT